MIMLSYVYRTVNLSKMGKQITVTSTKHEWEVTKRTDQMRLSMVLASWMLHINRVSAQPRSICSGKETPVWNLYGSIQSTNATFNLSELSHLRSAQRPRSHKTTTSPCQSTLYTRRHIRKSGRERDLRNYGQALRWRRTDRVTVRQPPGPDLQSIKGTRHSKRSSVRPYLFTEVDGKSAAQPCLDPGQVKEINWDHVTKAG